MKPLEQLVAITHSDKYLLPVQMMRIALTLALVAVCYGVFFPDFFPQARPCHERPPNDTVSGLPCMATEEIVTKPATYPPAPSCAWWLHAVIWWAALVFYLASLLL